MVKFQGIFCPLATPFDHREEVYRTKVKHNIGRLNLTSISGYIVGSSAGEREALSVVERRALWQLVREASAEGKAVIADVSAGSVKESVELALAAADVGCHAVWLTPPLGRGSAALHFQAVADKSSVPVVIAETPGDAAGQSALFSAAAHPNVAAICCDTTGDIQSPLERLPKGCAVLASRERGLAQSLKDKSQAAAVPLANALPFHLLSIAEAARTREYEAAEDLERRLLPPVEAIDRHGLAALKYAMDLRGMYGGSPRLPLTPLNPAAKQEVETALDGLAS